LKEHNVSMTASQYETEFSLAVGRARTELIVNNCTNLCLNSVQISALALRQKKTQWEMAGLKNCVIRIFEMSVACINIRAIR